MNSVNNCSLSIVGDGSVGKSTITAAFKEEGFHEVSRKVYKQTIGVDFYEKKLQIRENLVVSLRVWDVGGQSIQSKNLQSYVAHSNVVLLVYDVTNTESFLNLEDWLSQVRKIAKPDAVIFLVGNKVDLIALRQVTPKQHDQFIKENDTIKGGIYVSAKTGENVVKVFYKVAAESMGVKLTEYELAFHNKVLTAHIDTNKELDVKNAWADDIEKEDAMLEEKKLKREEEGCACTCC